MKRTTILLLALLNVMMQAQAQNRQPTNPSDAGTHYINPIVRADFPDPDVIRVGNTYYMVSTTMQLFPGATIIKSEDLVNWEYCAQPLKSLLDDDRYNLRNGKNAYAKGMWASSMKYHNGRFWLLVNGNDDRAWLLSATDPEGEWDVRRLSRNYYDPGMLFDGDKVYIACGYCNISMCELDADFNFIQEKEIIVRERSGLEGCHVYKIGDYYYIYATYGGFPSGQAAFRSKSPFGPFEEKMLVEKHYDGKINTIHQGALFEDTEGKWWTVMQEDLGAFGRFPNLLPVEWQDGWPIVAEGKRPPVSFVDKIPAPRKQNAHNSQSTQNAPSTQSTQNTPSIQKVLPTSDDFSGKELGMQWQWNHNPVAGGWSLTERPGWLRLKAVSTAAELHQARGMLTQRIFADPDKASTGTIRLDVSKLKPGDRAGICIFQDPQAMIGVEKKDNKFQVFWRQDTLRVDNNFTPKETVAEGVEVNDIIYLRATIDYATSLTKFYYSLDNKEWNALGGETKLSFNLNVFVGARYGLFCYATKAAGGSADFDWFTTEADFDEDAIYPAFTATIDEKMFTVNSLKPSKTSMEAMIGGWCAPILTATFADKHTENVTTQTSFECETPGIVEFRNGQMIGIGEGTTNVTATYTDAFGNQVQTTFMVTSSLFPTEAQFITTNVVGQGSYRKNATTCVFKPGSNGQVGWVYPEGIDLSAYKYLVVKLNQKQTADAKLNIYTSNKVNGACHTTPAFGTELQIVVDLKNAKNTSNTLKNRPLSTEHVYMITFTGNGTGTIVMKDIYVTNNDDYSRMDPSSGISDISMIADDTVSVYTLTGTMLRHRVPRTEATRGLPAGIYVVGGRKIAVR